MQNHALTLIILTSLAAPLNSHACDLKDAQYSYSGGDSITARFLESSKLSGWPSQNYIDIEVGKKHVYLIFDRGSARQVALISSGDPEKSIPTPDGGSRPYGSMTYISWNKINIVNNDIPQNIAPEYFIIPELPERLAHSNNPTSINLGIFELHCKNNNH